MNKIIAVVLFVGFNLLLSLFSLRLDLSEGRAYTLSQSTKKILKKIDKPVDIKFFVSSDLPTRFLPLKTEVADLLSEYKKQGGSKLSVSILDPKKDDKALEEVKAAGISELQFSQLEKDKYAVTSSYFGIAIKYQDKSEVLNQLTDIESLEYNLTALIYRLTRKESIKIGIVGYQPVYDPKQDPIYSLTGVLGQQFELGFPDKEITDDYNTILVFDNNQKEYTEEEINSLKNYLEKGKAIFFVDDVWVLPGLMTSSAKHNLNSLIDDWGINLNNNLLLSTAAEMVNFGYQDMSYFTPYPFWLMTNNFDSQISYFNNINQLTFPWASSLTLSKKESYQTKAIIKTTDRSWEQKEATGSAGFTLDPQGIPQPNQKDFKEFIVAAESKNKNDGKIIVFSSSKFVLDNYLSRSANNLNLVLNIVNDLASGGALSGIRARAVYFYPLPELTESQKDLFKYLNILLLPSLLAIYGGLRLFKRR